jgi:bile acid:Na+ symporter, BASS family
MDPIDQIHINFSEEKLAILNIAMAFLIFSVALDVRLDDFRQVFRFPKSILVGLIAQYLWFPLLTLAVVLTFKPPVSVGLGMLLIAACPSGNMTNFLVHFARGNLALSLTLNALILLAASVLTPVIFGFWSQFVPDSAAIRQTFHLSFVKMALIIVQLIVVPLALGMILNDKFPSLVARIRKAVQRVALLLFFTILVLAVAGNMDIVRHQLGHVFGLVAIQNAAALALGYFWAKMFKLPEGDCRTLSFETGVHNTALGLILIFNFFGGLGGMALIAAWYGIWDLVSGYALAAFFRRSNG